MTSPAAKAAQQIAEKAAKKCTDVMCTYASMQPEVYYRMRAALSPIIQQALSDSLRPYKELVEKWRAVAAASPELETAKQLRQALYDCADELEALIKQEEQA